MSDDWLYSGEGPPDEQLKELSQTLGALRYQGDAPTLDGALRDHEVLAEAPTAPSTGSWRGLALAAAALFTLALGADALHDWRTPEGWALSAESGCPDDDCLLRVGEELLTTETTWLDVADIGRVELSAGSRLRLARSDSEQHRLVLDQGHMDALVLAPPRLFIVDTPAVQAVDLGCAYSLDVDEAGNAELQVTSGWVALESPSRQVVVPAGAKAVTPMGLEPGTPYFLDAPREVWEALPAFDWGPAPSKAEALERVLSHARPRDSLTLVHMLPVVDRATRGRIFDKLKAEHTLYSRRQLVLDLDPTALEALREELSTSW